MLTSINTSNSPKDNILEQQYMYIWIDVLGTKNFLRNNNNNTKILNNILDNLKKRFKENDYKIEVKSIGDGLLLSLVISNISFIIFQEIIQFIENTQISFILENEANFFLRGGIAIVIDTEIEQNQYTVNRGLAMAVNIESKSVHWPVIGTDEDNLKVLKNIFSADTDKIQEIFINDYNAKGEKLYFINFLNSISKNKLSNFIQCINKQFDKINIKKNCSLRNKYFFLIKHIAIQTSDTKYLSLNNKNRINEEM